MMLFKNNALIIIIYSLKNKINLESNMPPVSKAKGCVTLHTTHTHMGKIIYMCIIMERSSINFNTFSKAIIIFKNSRKHYVLTRMVLQFREYW